MYVYMSIHFCGSLAWLEQRGSNVCVHVVLMFKYVGSFHCCIDIQSSHLYHLQHVILVNSVQLQEHLVVIYLCGESYTLGCRPLTGYTSKQPVHQNMLTNTQNTSYIISHKLLAQNKPNQHLTTADIMHSSQKAISIAHTLIL